MKRFFIMLAVFFLMLGIAGLGFSKSWTNFVFRSSLSGQAYDFDLAIDQSSFPVAVYADSLSKYSMSIVRYTNAGTWNAVTNNFSIYPVQYANIEIDTNGDYKMMANGQTGGNSAVYRFTTNTVTKITNFSVLSPYADSAAIISLSNVNLWLDVDYGKRYIATPLFSTNDVEYSTSGISAGAATYVGLASDGHGYFYASMLDYGLGNRATVYKYTNVGAWIKSYSSANVAGAPSISALGNDIYFSYVDKVSNAVNLIKSTNNGVSWFNLSLGKTYLPITVDMLSLYVYTNGNIYLGVRDTGNANKLGVYTYSVQNRAITNLAPAFTEAFGYSITNHNTNIIVVSTNIITNISGDLADTNVYTNVVSPITNVYGNIVTKAYSWTNVYTNVLTTNFVNIIKFYVTYTNVVTNIAGLNTNYFTNIAPALITYFTNSEDPLYIYTNTTGPVTRINTNIIQAYTNVYTNAVAVSYLNAWTRIGYSLTGGTVGKFELKVYDEFGSGYTNWEVPAIMYKKAFSKNELGFTQYK